MRNPAVETMFRPESKHCVCGFEVRYQQPSNRIGGEDVENGDREFFEVVAIETGLRS